MPENSYAETTGQSPVMASEPNSSMGQMMEDRKLLGPTPIGTERAARRPPPPQLQNPTSSYHSDFGFQGSSDAPSMWPFTTDGEFNCILFLSDSRLNVVALFNVLNSPLDGSYLPASVFHETAGWSVVWKAT